jgi:hypothetical protein
VRCVFEVGKHPTRGFIVGGVDVVGYALLGRLRRLPSYHG